MECPNGDHGVGLASLQVFETSGDPGKQDAIRDLPVRPPDPINALIDDSNSGSNYREVSLIPS
jgi:hypothetical protein